MEFFCGLNCELFSIKSFFFVKTQRNTSIKWKKHDWHLVSRKSDFKIPQRKILFEFFFFKIGDCYQKKSFRKPKNCRQNKLWSFFFWKQVSVFSASLRALALFNVLLTVSSVSHFSAVKNKQLGYFKSPNTTISA